MKEIFDEFKKELNPESQDKLYENLAATKETLRGKFLTEFPDLESDLFLKSKRWLELAGTSMSEEYSEEVPTEVEMWVTKELTGLIDTL